MSMTLGVLSIAVVALFAAALLPVVRSYRLRRKATTAVPRGELVVELAWSVIPWLILVGAVTPAVIGIIHDSKVSPVQPGILEPGGH
jgi:heme/copper-type cytochrome/quinol oxidase subunit 2